MGERERLLAMKRKYRLSHKILFSYPYDKRRGRERNGNRRDDSQ